LLFFSKSVVKMKNPGLNPGYLKFTL